jgi:hypothetical protein
MAPGNPKKNDRSVIREDSRYVYFQGETEAEWKRSLDNATGIISEHYNFEFYLGKGYGKKDAVWTVRAGDADGDGSRRVWNYRETKTLTSTQNGSGRYFDLTMEGSVSSVVSGDADDGSISSPEYLQESPAQGSYVTLSYDGDLYSAKTVGSLTLTNEVTPQTLS